MAQSEAGFRAAHRVWEASWVNGPDWNDSEPPIGTCPTCGGETDNGRQDADEDGPSWTFTDCAECDAACADCGESGIKKDAEDETRCPECAKLDREAKAEAEQAEGDSPAPAPEPPAPATPAKEGE